MIAPLLLCALAPVVNGTPGTNGVPQLTTSPPVYGTTLQIELASARSGAPAFVFHSTDPGPLTTPFGVIGLGPAALELIGGGTVAGDGTLTVSVPLVDHASLFGHPVNLQAGVQDNANPTGVALSNSVHTSLWGCDVDADTNRDGVVQAAAGVDDKDEELWSTDGGAIFLYNNDDDDDDGVVDANDMVVNGTADELDLARVHLRAMPDAPPGWTGMVEVDTAASTRVRLFRHDGVGGWTRFDPALHNPLSTADLQAGIEFGIEARDFAQTSTNEPGKWTGEALVTVRVLDDTSAEQCRDEVRLRVAPFLLYSNLAAGETAYVTHKTYTTTFVNDLDPLVTNAGATLDPIDGITMEPSYGIWVQDALEFGYSVLPAAGSPHVLPTVLRSPRGNNLDAWTLDHRFGPDFGYLYEGWTRSGVGWIDWFGNLDCTPPLPGWPLGRIYTGYQGSTTIHPKVLELFDAQAVQGPVLQIDTDWLLIGHVDEAISFVPANTGTPYRMLIPNAVDALQILTDLQNAGSGGLAVFAGTSDATTVNGLLSWTSFVTYNQNLQASIDGVRQQMKTGLGIAEADIIDVPCLFWKSTGNRAIAHMPNMVNALVLGNHFIAADPFGPVDGGTDKFKEPVVQALSAIGMQVQFIDDWYPYHSWAGEVHCGTNAVRTPPSLPWWTVD